MSHVLARHVEGADHMAEGYTRAAAGNIGVCLGTSGPAGTDMITGLYSAAADSIPILCITGQAPTPRTEARLRGHGLVDVVRWMAERPAEIAGLSHKGGIERGYHADFAVFAPDAAFVVDPDRLHHRHPVTPYAHRPLAGVVRSTWLRGARVTGDEPRGHLISRGEA